MSKGKDNQEKNVLDDLANSGQIIEQLRQLGASEEGEGQGVFTHEEEAQLTAFRLGMPYIDLSLYQIQPEALRLIPEALARKHNVIPLAIVDNALQVAMAEADDVLALEALAIRARMRIHPVVAVATDIQDAIDRSYKAYGEIEEQFGEASVTPDEEKILAEAIASAPAVRALDLIVDEAIKNRASDIHIEPGEDRLRVRFRIDGVLQDTMSLSLSAHAPLISRLKILSGINIADNRPQDGQFSVKVR